MCGWVTRNNIKRGHQRFIFQFKFATRLFHCKNPSCKHHRIYHSRIFSAKKRVLPKKYGFINIVEFSSRIFCSEHPICVFSKCTTQIFSTKIRVLNSTIFTTRIFVVKIRVVSIVEFNETELLSSSLYS